MNGDPRSAADQFAFRVGNFDEEFAGLDILELSFPRQDRFGAPVRSLPCATTSRSNHPRDTLRGFSDERCRARRSVGLKPNFFRRLAPYSLLPAGGNAKHECFLTRLLTIKFVFGYGVAIPLGFARL